MQEIMKNSGLSENTLEKIKYVFKSNDKIESLIIFGSRAKGTYRNGSDIDLAIKSKGAFKTSEIFALKTKLDELDLPYEFDVVHYESLENNELIDHINRVGVALF